MSIRTLATLTFVAAAAVSAHAQPAAPVKDFDVYVDLPSAFAYIKTPVGWKFIRKLETEQLKQLHETTFTSLLPVADETLAQASTSPDTTLRLDLLP